MLAAIAARGEEIGVRLLTTEDGKPPAVEFDYGFKTRPFFPKLVEPVEQRCASLDQQGLDRQFVATWPDIYGYGLRGPGSARCFPGEQDGQFVWTACSAEFAGGKYRPEDWSELCKAGIWGEQIFELVAPLPGEIVVRKHRFSAFIDMRFVLGLAEGVVTRASDGCARMADRPVATLLHLGPGLVNGLANLHNARRERAPILNIVGDHASCHLKYEAPFPIESAILA